MKPLLLLACLLYAMPGQAQPLPVNQWANWSSYGTAVSNLAGAVSSAAQGDHKACDFGRLALSLGTETTVTLWAKSKTNDPRPCTGAPGCNTDSGNPSGHTALGMIGLRTAWSPQLAGWQRIMLAVSTAAVTGLLRNLAHEHYWRQIGWGALVGAGSESAALLVRCDGT